VTAVGEHPLQAAAAVEPVRDQVPRRRLFTLAARGVGSAATAGALGAFVGACGSSASSSTGTATSSARSNATADLEIVNYALTLEYLQAQFYAAVIKSGLFAGAAALATIERFGAEEEEHVQTLQKLVAKLGPAAEKPVARFPLTDAVDVARLAATLENVTAAAYLDLVMSVKNTEILATTVAIHSVEARHAATLGTLVKKSVTPNGAFATPADMSTVLAAVKPFLA